VPLEPPVLLFQEDGHKPVGDILGPRADTPDPVVRTKGMKEEAVPVFQHQRVWLRVGEREEKRKEEEKKNGQTADAEERPEMTSPRDHCVGVHTEYSQDIQVSQAPAQPGIICLRAVLLFQRFLITLFGVR
jgi:hypothetical protein